MIGIELIREYVHTVILTGRVAEEAPISTFLIAPPENGKTNIVLEKSFPSVVDVTDATGRGLVEIIKHKAEVSHIILNDLTAIAAHGKNVRAYTIAMINAMTEEGIRSIAFPGQVDVFQYGKRGIIACATPSLVSDGRSWWNKIGLMSRILPFHYHYSGNLILRIKSSIDAERKFSDSPPLKIPAITIKVFIPEKETIELRKLSDQKAKELGDDTGIRRLKQFRRLAKAHALLGTWKNPKVGQADIDFIKRIFPFISYGESREL